MAQGDGGGEEGGETADAGDDVEGVVVGIDDVVGEEGHGAGDEVDAGGDHGGGVDECGDGGGAFHGVGEPYVEGELGRFAKSAKHEAEGDPVEDGGVGGHELGVGEDGEDLGVFDGAEIFVDEEDADGEAEVADAVDDEGLFGGGDGGGFLKVVADEEVAGEADAFPAQVEEDEVVGHDEAGHEEDEEGEVGEEAEVAIVAFHVPGGVDEDQQADAGDEGQIKCSEMVDGDGDGYAEVAGG